MSRSDRRSYKERFGSAKKPQCFGEPTEYSLSHSVCRDCDWKGRCRVLVNRKLDREAEEAEEEERTRGRRDDEYDATDYEEREDDGGLGFLGALAVNSGLSAAERVAEEVRYSLQQIPRFAYPDPFAEAIKRGRRKVKEDE